MCVQSGGGMAEWKHKKEVTGGREGDGEERKAEIPDSLPELLRQQQSATHAIYDPSKSETCDKM